MPKVLVFSDLQAHTHKAYGKRTGDGLNSRFEVSLNVLESLREFCVDSGIKDVFFAGDMFETNNRVPVTVINAVADEFALWVEAGIKMLAIPGNHDHAVRSGSVHAMEFLKHVGRGQFNVISDPCVFDYRLSDLTKIRVTALPYRRQLQDPKGLEEPPPTKGARARVLLAHGNVETFCPQPFKAPEDDTGRTPIKDWIRKDWLADFDYAFVGHIHQREHKFINGCWVYSPGCPYQENASAYGEKRGFYVWDVEQKEVRPYNVAGIPKFVKVKIPVVGDIAWPEDVEGDIVLLEPESTSVPYEAVRGAKERLYGSGADYVDTRPAADQIRPRKDLTRASLEDVANPIKVLSEVVAQDMINMRGTSEEELVLLAHQVVSDAKAESPTSPGIVQLERVEGRDVLCFQAVDIDLAGRGLLGVGGENRDTSYADSNGTGKSSMFDLIAWALYGRTLREIRADGVIRRGRPGCRALIRFTAADGVTYEVFRTREDRVWGSDLHFHKVSESCTIDAYQGCLNPDDDLRGEDKRDTQARIERTLGLNMEAFRSLVVLGQGGGRRFSELKDSERKHFLGEVLGLNMYKELSERARVMGRKSEREYDMLGVRIDRIREEYAKTSARLADCKEKAESWEQRKQEKIAGLIRQWEEAQAAYDVNLKELEEAQRKDVTSKEEIARVVVGHTKESKRVAKTIDEVNDKHEEDNRKLIQERARVMAWVKSLMRDRDRISEVVEAGKCPTCGQDAHDGMSENVDSINAEINEQKILLEEVDKKVRDLDLSRKDVVAALREERNMHESKITELRAELLVSTEHESNVNRMLQLKGVKAQRVDSLYSRIESARAETNDLLGILESTEKELQEAKEEGIKARAEQDAVDNRKRAFAALADAWGPKGARSLLFDGVVPSLNEHLARYSEVICGQYLAVQVATTAEAKARGKIKEEITLNVHTLEGVVPFGSCSGGEQRRMDVPILLALQDVASAHGRGMGVCFLDEAFENLDGSGADGLFDLLELASERACTSSVFVVTHDQDIFSGFTKTMTFRKEMGVSSVT